MIKKEIIYRGLFSILTIILILFLFAFLWDLSLPRGQAFIGEEYGVHTESVEFLYDLTYENSDGELQYEQGIFDKVYEVIENAEEFIIVDMFLFGEDGDESYRDLTGELVESLINKKKETPEIKIYFVTDSFNLFYKSSEKDHFDKFVEEGIAVSFVSMDYLDKDLDFFSRFIKRFHARLNHRKVIVADKGAETVFIVGSANPHNPSSPNSNVAVYVEGGPVIDILNDEINFLPGHSINFENYSSSEGELSVRYLRNGGLVNLLLNEINETEGGDSVDIATFMLSEIRIVEALVEASQRDVDIRIVLYQNIESFGRKQNGMPNTIVAEVLERSGKGEIDVRWYKTHGEQFHTKLAIVERNGYFTILLGSSNLTPKGGANYNMEADIGLRGLENITFVEDVRSYYERIWNNVGGNYTLN
jgi:cardiolipin synthase A/B